MLRPKEVKYPLQEASHEALVKKMENKLSSKIVCVGDATTGKVSSNLILSYFGLFT